VIFNFFICVNPEYDIPLLNSKKNEQSHSWMKFLRNALSLKVGIVAAYIESIIYKAITCHAYQVYATSFRSHLLFLRKVKLIKIFV